MISTPRAAVVAVLIAVGSFFLLVGTVGLLRLPNVYNRMHATSKAATLGTSSILVGATVYFLPDGDGLAALVGVVFLFFTAPTGAHVISRAARRMGVPFLDGVTWPGELDGDPDPDDETGPTEDSPADD